MRKRMQNKEPKVMLHGRIMYRTPDGDLRDETQNNSFGLKKLSEAGAQAIYNLNQIRKRLNLLFIAAEHRAQVDAGLVRLAVEDIRGEMQDGYDLDWYLRMTQEMFENSEPLPPIPAPDKRDTGRSLTLVKPAS